MSAKMKTNKGAAKRFGKTTSGKIKRHHANAGHLFTGKTRKRKRQLRKSEIMAPADAKRVNRLIPYV